VCCGLFCFLSARKPSTTGAISLLLMTPRFFFKPGNKLDIRMWNNLIKGYIIITVLILQSSELSAIRSKRLANFLIGSNLFQVGSSWWSLFASNYYSNIDRCNGRFQYSHGCVFCQCEMEAIDMWFHSRNKSQTRKRSPFILAAML